MSGAWDAGMMLVNEADRRFNQALVSNAEMADVIDASAIWTAQLLRQCSLPAPSLRDFGWKQLQGGSVSGHPAIIAALQRDEVRLMGVAA